MCGSRGWHTNALRRALVERGAEVVLAPIDALVARVGGRPRLRAEACAIDSLDAVLVRTIPRGSLEQIIFRIDALHRLARLGVPVVNPAAVIERTVDKFFTSALLEEAGIRTPPTIVTETMADAMEAFREFGDVIVKPLFGSNGRGMVRVDDEEIAYRVFRALERSRDIFYVQRAIPHEGRDVRALVVGDRVVAAGRRCATGWRTNASRGALMEPITLPAEWETLSLDVARLLGADVAGVDLLPAGSGELFVLEVNGIPGWRRLQATTAVDIAGAIADHLLARVAVGS